MTKTQSIAKRRQARHKNRRRKARTCSPANSLQRRAATRLRRNTERVAKRLGVQAGTIRRWLSSGRAPRDMIKSKHDAHTLAALHDQYLDLQGL